MPVGECVSVCTSVSVCLCFPASASICFVAASVTKCDIDDHIITKILLISTACSIHPLKLVQPFSHFRLFHIVSQSSFFKFILHWLLLISLVFIHAFPFKRPKPYPHLP